jgi:dTDP-4-amino-4,6-dideoxygalactose transaminase
LDAIQQRRTEIWNLYAQELAPLHQNGRLRLPVLPAGASNNAHMFYVVTQSIDQRTGLIEHLKANHINAVFHYLSLHASPYYTARHDGRVLPLTDHYSETLLRLPMYFELTNEDVVTICNHIKQYYA